MKQLPKLDYPYYIKKGCLNVLAHYQLSNAVYVYGIETHLGPTLLGGTHFLMVMLFYSLINVHIGVFEYCWVIFIKNVNLIYFYNDKNAIFIYS